MLLAAAVAAAAAALPSSLCSLRHAVRKRFMVFTAKVYAAAPAEPHAVACMAPTSSSLKKPNETAATWAVVISLLCRLDCMALQGPSQGAQGFLSAARSGPPVHCLPKFQPSAVFRQRNFAFCDQPALLPCWLPHVSSRVFPPLFRPLLGVVTRTDQSHHTSTTCPTPTAIPQHHAFPLRSMDGPTARVSY